VGGPSLTHTNVDSLGYIGELASMLVLGDFNGDGYADLAVGAGWFDDGPIIVVNGSSSGLTQGTVDLSNPTFTPPSGASFFGCGIAASDYNGTAYSNLLVDTGAEGASGAGNVFLFGGSSTGIADAAPNFGDPNELEGFDNGSSFGCVINQ
jgi:FG-GAP repeat